MYDLDFLDKPLADHDEWISSGKEKDAIFAKDFNLLCHTLIGRNGVMFDHLGIKTCGDGSMRADHKNKKFLFSDSVGPIDNKTVTGITHELAHVMITEDSDCVLGDFGIRIPRQYCTGPMFGFDPVSSSNASALKLESRVWAWQYLIECTAGLRNFGDTIPRHSEAEYLPYYPKQPSGEEADIYTDSLVKKYIREILQEYPDFTFMDAIHKRIADMEMIIQNYEDGFDPDAVTVHTEEYPWGADADYKLRYDICMTKFGYYTAYVCIMDNCEGGEIYYSEEIAHTKNIEKAKRNIRYAIDTNTNE